MIHRCPETGETLIVVDSQLAASLSDLFDGAKLVGRWAWVPADKWRECQLRVKDALEERMGE